jgi:hypothetical protein
VSNTKKTYDSNLSVPSDNCATRTPPPPQLSTNTKDNPSRLRFQLTTNYHCPLPRNPHLRLQRPKAILRRPAQGAQDSRTHTSPLQRQTRSITLYHIIARVQGFKKAKKKLTLRARSRHHRFVVCGVELPVALLRRLLGGDERLGVVLVRWLRAHGVWAGMACS